MKIIVLAIRAGYTVSDVEEKLFGDRDWNPDYDILPVGEAANEGDEYFDPWFTETGGWVKRNKANTSLDRNCRIHRRKIPENGEVTISAKHITEE